MPRPQNRSMPLSSMTPMLVGLVFAALAIGLLVYLVILSSGQVETDADGPDGPAINAPDVAQVEETRTAGPAIRRIHDPLVIEPTTTPSPDRFATDVAVAPTSTATVLVLVEISTTPRIIRTPTAVYTSTPAGSFPTYTPPTTIPPAKPTPTTVPTRSPTLVPSPTNTATAIPPTLTPVPTQPNTPSPTTTAVEPTSTPSSTSPPGTPEPTTSPDVTGTPTVTGTPDLTGTPTPSPTGTITITVTILASETPSGTS